MDQSDEQITQLTSNIDGQLLQIRSNIDEQPIQLRPNADGQPIQLRPNLDGQLLQLRPNADKSHDQRVQEQIIKYFEKNPAVDVFPTKEFIQFCNEVFNFTSFFEYSKFSYPIDIFNINSNHKREKQDLIEKIWDKFHTEYLAKAQLEIAEKNQKKLDHILYLLEKLNVEN